MKSTSEGESGVTAADVREENDAGDSLMTPVLSAMFHMTCGECYISLNNFLFRIRERSRHEHESAL